MVIAAGLLSTALACVAPALTAEAEREVRVLMGTTAEVGVRGLPDPRHALAAAFAALQRVDDSMSLWKPDSELSRLNARGSATVSADLLAVLEGALDVASASEGAFDPTVEPLVRATGGLGEPSRPLGPRQRAAILGRVGFRRVEVDAARAHVRLGRGTRLDFGGIAKGYAVDLALAELRRAGAAAGYVDLGASSIGAFGPALDVELRDPERPQGLPLASFRLADAILATSAADQRGTHILDPRTGLPAAGTISVTVVARSGMEADALSTAVYVLGAGKGLALLESRGASGLVVCRENGRRVLRTTRGFAEARGLLTAPELTLR